MSGHSKWATIKRKKGAADAKRGNEFTKIIREMTVAAKSGGGNPDHNSRLRTAILKSKSINMPADNIKKAIQRGTGELPGVTYEEITYEGYGPGGAAITVETLTDNRNRAASEVRKIFSKYGGNLGESGCVSWIFEKKGFIAVDKKSTVEDDLMALILDAGALDMTASDSTYDITTKPEDFEKVKTAIKSKNIEPVVAEITMVPKSYVKLEGKQAEQLLTLMEYLGDNDDVQNVYANFDISDTIIEAHEKATT